MNRRRLLITDPLHPVVPETVVGLQNAAAAAGGPLWTVFGLVEGRAVGAALAAPPGVAELLAGPGIGEPGWVSRVVTLAVERRIDAVLPWTDREAVLLAPAATELRELGIALVCPPGPLVDLADDKWATMQRLAELGVATPASRPVDRGTELAAAARDLSYPGRSLVVKPRRSAGGRGVWVVRPDAGLEVTAPLPALPLYALMVAAATREQPLGLVVQELLPGVDVSVDVLALDGKVVASVARTRVRTLGGLCVEGVVGPVWPAVAELVEELVAALGWSQLLNVQLVWDPDTERGAVYELNARASGSIGTAGYVGVPMLSAAVELAITGRAPALPSAGERRWFRRHWVDQVGPA